MFVSGVCFSMPITRVKTRENGRDFLAFVSFFSNLFVALDYIICKGPSSKLEE